MKLKLNKKNLKNLSKDAKTIPADMTPQVAGGARLITLDDCEDILTRMNRCSGAQLCL
ncbi:hypothetical protein [Pseudoalteromonas denitrificans]|uniref:Uncharacterized protein n=1 Tax=Pseudoalteromonas denitrificans DSM 6059 TaxID=1123010 RepID=A0A1I1S458_9GAMM|nr:hypothetical protein [Pseudoalteromonas denitrificans]SFD41269.1 hypothetical protein SAMN02745724_04450 [Pseudoalteromonas denitrificans DSM 6059]